jgi:high-affinity nickel-transport protein
MRARIVNILVLLVATNVAAWAWALIALHHSPVLLSTALLAYSLGLRHAFDADHIAAIDNVTRKLIHEGKRPLATGLFFALGHSTVVVALTVAIALTTVKLADRRQTFEAIGTGISAVFLLAIAAANFLVLIQVYRTYRSIRRGELLVEEHLDRILAQRGFLGHIFPHLFRLIGHSWQMYPLGFLFGLGFDTATEVGFLGISASQAAHGLPIVSILVFPALFAAGMALMDTADGMVMLGAYGWAFMKPIRKLHYNLTMTFVSVAVALGVGGIEVLTVIRGQFLLNGPFWDSVGAAGDDFGALGIAIAALFGASWLISFVIYHAKGFDAPGAGDGAQYKTMAEVK